MVTKSCDLLTAIIMLGTLPCLANTSSLATVSSLPTISGKVVGRYFSILQVETKTGNQSD